MKIFLSALISLFSVDAFSQKTIEVNDDNSSKDFYNNLVNAQKDYQVDSIQNINEKTIRIWKGLEIFIFNKNSYFVKKFKNLKTRKSHLYKLSIKENLDSFNIDRIKKIAADYYIDCFPIAIEIIDTSHHFVKVVGCNKEIVALINKIRTNELELGVQDFIEKLPSGEYQDFMTTFIVNQPIKDSTKKSSFYKKIEIELLTKRIEISNPTSQPLIFINNKQAYFEDINNLDKAKLKSYKIINDNQKLIFGTKAEYGVILIETKK